MNAAVADTPPPGSARYFAWLYAPPPLQSILQPLLGIEAQIGAALRPGLEHSVAHARLQWWREECARAARDGGAHPLTRSLLAQRPPGHAVQCEISGLVDTATWDLAAVTFASQPELEGYCARWAAAVTGLASQWALPAAVPQAVPGRGRQAQHADAVPAAQRALDFGRGLGGALRELELLLELAAAARAGRLRLPLDELEQAGIDPAQLGRPPYPPPLAELLRGRHRRLRRRLRTALAGLPSPTERAALRGLVVWAQLSCRHSQLAEQALPQVPRRQRSSGLADAWWAWRYARAARRVPPQLMENEL